MGMLVKCKSERHQTSRFFLGVVYQKYIGLTYCFYWVLKSVALFAQDAGRCRHQA